VNAASACRIAAAFSAGTKSDDVPELIGEAEAAAVSAGEASQCARAKALDPALSAKDVAIARHEMEDAAFRRDRMQTAETKLGERLRELRGQEEDHRRWLAYEKAKAERDKLVVELKEVYPTFAARLGDLAVRIDANDREIEKISNKKGIAAWRGSISSRM
jgi:flagellar motility protein MotE (MotC chaperone)